MTRPEPAAAAVDAEALDTLYRGAPMAALVGVVEAFFLSVLFWRDVPATSIAWWLVAFAALALLTAPARRAGAALRVAALGWAEARRRAADDERTWQVAVKDPRIMAELNHAMGIATVEDIRKYY